MRSIVNFKSRFTQSALTLVSGSILAQSITIAVTPILTRIYTPEDFGALAILTSIIGVLAIITTFRFEMAILLPKENHEALDLVYLSLTLNILVGFIILIVVYLFKEEISILLGVGHASQWLYYLPIATVTVGFIQVLNCYLNRNVKYKNMATSKVIQAGSSSATSIAVGVVVPSINGLMLGYLIGAMFAAGYYLKISLASLVSHRFNFNALVARIREHRKFAIFSMPNGIVDTSRVALINILLARLYSSEIVGSYSMGMRVIQLPMGIISSSMSQVLYKELVNRHNNNKSVTNYLNSFIIKVAILSFPLFLLLYFFSSEIFLFILGDGWQIAGEFAEIMSPWLYLSFLTSPLSIVFPVFNKQEKILLLSLLYFLVPVLLLFVFGGNVEAHLLLTYITVGMCIVLALMLVYVQYILRAHDRSLVVGRNL